MAMSKIKALQTWCKRTLEGYRDVNITDMTTSWRSGLAFCAMIHKFRPDLIDYDALDKENVYENNKLAFDVAEKELNIAALLEASDMVAMKVPDKLSVITYVAQYHNYFRDKPVLGGPGIRVANKTATPSGTKRHHEGTEPQSRPEVKRFTPSHENKQDKPQEKPKQQRLASMGETCQICRNKVYLLERHIEDGKLYHRSCYRHSDLSPSGKVYAKPSALFQKDDKKDSGKEDKHVNGMSQLGKGFAAPDRTPGQRSRSPVRSTAKMDLNVKSDSEERYKPRSHGHDDREARKKATDNGRLGDPRNDAKSILDKLEEQSKSDWKSKRSHSPKAERKPNTSSAHRPIDLPGMLSEPSDKKITDKWPPSKDDKSSRSRSEGSDQKTTPVPRPRKSLLKEEEHSPKMDTKPERSSRVSRHVEKMDVDEPMTKQSENSYSTELEAWLTKRSESRKLPLALQAGLNDKNEEKSESSKLEKKESADITDPTPKTRLFLKKTDKKLSGSTEKLNKTVGERIKESKERSKLRTQEERSKTNSEDKSDRLLRDRSKSVTPPAISPDEPSSAPPLPKSTPPELPKSPPSQTTSPSTAPPRPPRSPTTPQSAPTPTPRSGPPKPPRVGLTDSTTKETPPQDASGKAGVRNRSSPPVAIMVYPTSPPPQEEDQRVLGGLLKSLANVRQRQPDSPTRIELTTESRTSRQRQLDSPTKPELTTKSKTSRQRQLDSPTKPELTTESRTSRQRQLDSPTKPELTTKSKTSRQRQLDSPTKPELTTESRTSRQRQLDSPTKPELTTESKTSIAIPPRTHVSSPTENSVLSNNIKNSHSKTSANLDSKHKEQSHVSKSKHNQKGASSSGEVIDTTPIPAWQKEVARRKAEKDNKSKQRPKSTTAILDYLHGKEEMEKSQIQDKNKPLPTPEVDTTPTPAWQKEARRRKENNTKLAQQKSMDVLSDENGDLCVGEDNLRVLNLTKDLKKRDNKKSKETSKSQESVPDWQKEAQKRIEERKGNFVDPEKKRIAPERPEPPHVDRTTKKHIEIIENGDSSEKKNVGRPERTKVSPGIKFNFDDSSLDSSSEFQQKEEKHNKGRQPPPRPKSPPAVNRAQKHQRYSAGNKMSPLRPGMSPGKLTPMEIQRQLLDIDSKLTDLELKGRRLEDSIRNAQEDEEDMLMIDWFLLVSKKNELVRQEADLIYASRENELEDEQDSVQNQLRQLLDKPNKTSEDKQEEEYLLERLLYIVDQRSKIIDCIDDDKHRYEEEDREIAIVLEKKANSKTQERLL